MAPASAVFRQRQRASMDRDAMVDIANTGPDVVSAFYEDCEIFITGGSGIVGKALIEKLLRSCNVRRIYILLRPKKNRTAAERLEGLRSAKIFRVLNAKEPAAFDKLVAIPGDATLPRLGLAPNDAALLANVSIVFHCAATVRFDEPLKDALRLNVAGTLETLKFAETLQRLKSFLYVSTFFSNPYLRYVEPKVYSSPMDWRQCLKLLEDDADECIIDGLTRKLIVGFPNTYTFTKNLAERVVDEYRDRLPVIIYRPSVVLFALTEPEVAFPPGVMGALGLTTLIGAGILKTVLAEMHVRLDITPLDAGIKCMLYYAQQAGAIYQRGVPPTTPTYMFSSAQVSRHPFVTICRLSEQAAPWHECAFEKCLLIPGCHFTDSPIVYNLLVLSKQLLPALMGDALLRLCGQPPVIAGIVRKTYISLAVMRPFLSNSYDSDGITDYDAMCRALKGTDFEFADDLAHNATDSGIMEYSKLVAYQIRQVIMNEDPLTIPKAQRILKIKIIVYNVVRAIAAFYALRSLARRYCPALVW